MTVEPDAPTPDPMTAAHPPFGATVRAVLTLLPDATVARERPEPTTAVPGAPAPPARVARAVTVDEVGDWIDELSATVANALDGWTRLPGEVTAGAGLSDRATLVAEARRLVHAGAASYFEAARARGGTGPTTGTTAYAEVLWTRFTDGLAALTATLARRLAGTDPSTPDEDGTGVATGLAVGHFPPARFTRRMGF